MLYWEFRVSFGAKVYCMSAGLALRSCHTRSEGLCIVLDAASEALRLICIFIYPKKINVQKAQFIPWPLTA